MLSSTANGTGTVCADRWDDVDADVLCRQMGFPSGTASYLPRDYLYNRAIFNVRCTGNETNVQQCPVDHYDMFGNCASLGDAGVNCNNITQSELWNLMFIDLQLTSLSVYDVILYEIYTRIVV